MGVLRQKCVPSFEQARGSLNSSHVENNKSYESYLNIIDDSCKNNSVLILENYDRKINKFISASWYQENDNYVLCGNSTGSTKCPEGYICWKDRGAK